MKTPQEFEGEFFRRLKLVNGTWEVDIHNLARDLDFPEQYLKELLLEWACQTVHRPPLIEIHAYDLTDRDWKQVNQYKPASLVFAANHGALKIILHARGEELAKKRTIGF